MRRRRPRSGRPPGELLEVLAREPDGGGTRDVGDATGGAWLRNHLRGGDSLPPIHREVGTGSGVGFERVEVPWDPYVGLAHLLEERPEAGNHATEEPEEDP